MTKKKTWNGDTFWDARPTIDRSLPFQRKKGLVGRFLIAFLCVCVDAPGMGAVWEIIFFFSR